MYLGEYISYHQKYMDMFTGKEEKTEEKPIAKLSEL